MTGSSRIGVADVTGGAHGIVSGVAEVFVGFDISGVVLTDVEQTGAQTGAQSGAADSSRSFACPIVQRT